MAVNESTKLLQRLLKYMRANNFNAGEIGDLTGVTLEKMDAWGLPRDRNGEIRKGIKMYGPDKAAILELLDGPPTAQGPVLSQRVWAAPPTIAPATEDVVRHRTFIINHDTLCKLLGLPPEATELEIKQCNKTTVTLPWEIVAETTESTVTKAPS